MIRVIFGTREVVHFGRGDSLLVPPIQDHELDQPRELPVRLSISEHCDSLVAVPAPHSLV